MSHESPAVSNGATNVETAGARGNLQRPWGTASPGC